MRKNRILSRVIPFVLILAISITAWKYFNQNTATENPELLRARLSSLSENPEARAQFEFEMLRNPATGSIPEGVHLLERQQAKEIQEFQGLMKPMAVNAYLFQGPDNLGGRTRAIAYDVRYNGSSNQVILAGGVSGGIFKSTNDGASWSRKSPLDQLFSVTSVAQDPRPGFQDTWYYATGEALGNSASGSGGAFYLGNGIYKSTDNGETWTRLPNSNTTSLEAFNARQDLISKVIVDADGVVYFAAADGIYRSTDGGSTWSLVLSSGAGGINTGMVCDIVATSTAPSRLYASFSGLNNTAPTNMPGVWTSATGASGSWTKIAGETAATNPAGWDVNGSYRRVVLALAPSNENILYALYDDGDVHPSIQSELFRWNQATTTWTDLSLNLPDEPGGSSGNDPFANQNGYDLVVAVKPDDANVVFIGGTNIYRSTDGFTSTANYRRIGGYADPDSYASYPNSHADIHAIVFQPNNPAIMLCGNDGGIQRTTNNLAASVSWTNISNQYRTYQYYYVALDPRSANDKVMGGAQDNGTTRNIGASGMNFERILSGDGVSVGLANPVGGITYEYAGWQNGGIFRRNATWGADFGSDIRPSAATDAGLFVTLFKLDDDNTETIYYASDSSLYRNTSASAATTGNWTKLTGIEANIVDGALNGKARISALATTRGTYSAATASLFIGTSEGRVYRLNNPAATAAATAPVNITGGAFPSGGYVSSIAVNPRNDDTLLVTFSNYGVSSVFWTGNANAATPTWHNVEGSFTAPSYRSSAIAVTSDGVEYFVGTSVGLYKASIDATSPGATTWLQEGSAEIGNAVVSSLAFRPSDGKLLVGTHGAGMWTTMLNMNVLPVSLLDFNGILVKDKVQLKWTTGFEQDTRHFDVQKSADGTEFTRIGRVNAAGNSTTEQHYDFIDPQADAINYYRLKIVDVDGESRFSNVIVVKNSDVPQQVRILSNPFAARIDLRFSRQFTNLKAQLFTTGGALVAEKNFTSANAVSWQLNNNLTKGIYIMRIVADGKLSVHKLVKN